MTRFTNDPKYDAYIRAIEMAEESGYDYDTLSEAEQMKRYSEAFQDNEERKIDAAMLMTERSEYSPT